MKPLLIRLLGISAFFMLLAAVAPLRAQDQSGDWNLTLLDQILAGAQPGQKLVQVGDMQILTAKVQAWRDQLAGGATKLSALGSTPTWTGGDVYYTFATAETNAVSEEYQRAFLDAAEEWATYANIHFIPWTTQANYVTVQVNSGLEGGQATVGMAGGQQFLSVGPGAWNRGTLCHEIGHLLGLVHEHQRSDRTNYVTILTNNIVSGGIGNFVLLPGSINEGLYDFLSVMHYSRNYLSVVESSGFGSTNAQGSNTIVPLPGYTNYLDIMGEPGPVVLSDGDRAGMALVYGAVTATSSVVTNTQDSGPGSLRAALYYAFDHPGTHITFNIPTNDPGYTNGVFTIQPTDQLPWLVNATFLDGSSQPTNSQSNPAGPSIQINGSLAPRPDTYASGLLFCGTNCTLRSVIINGFSAYGILFSNNASGNTVEGCYLAVNAAGTAAVTNGLPAVMITGGASDNTIGGTNAAARNVISGSVYQGLMITGAGAANNVVEGNYIGLNAAGTAALPNGYEGIEIAAGAQGNYIGGTTAGARNIISGNTLQGILISDPYTTGNVVEGNYIGLNPEGTEAMANSVGVNITNGAQDNIIGGVEAGAGNVISGNGYQGVSFQAAGTSGNLVEGNWIGINAAGTAAIPNLEAGVAVYGPAGSNIIGGTVAGARNVISGGAQQGVAIGGSMGNIVEGNYLGLSSSGEDAISNAWEGVNLYGGSQSNIIGGTAPGAGNIISGNGIQGVSMQDSGTSWNVVEGNWIGLDATGSLAISNAADGVEIFSGAQSNIIGGTVPGAANVISGNAGDGVEIDETGTSNNTVEGNWIGLDVTGTAAVPNTYCGVELEGGSQNNVIGGVGGRNFLSGNTANGVLIDDGSFSNAVVGNTIGLNVYNAAAVPNGQAGVGMFSYADSNLIGGTALGAANLIASNLNGGIVLYYTDTTNNVLRCNSIFGNVGVGIGLYLGANQSYSENRPTITSATVATNTTRTTVIGTLSSLASTTFALDYYASAPPASAAQASTYLGTVNVTTGAGGSAGFTNMLGTSVPSGQVITATATDPVGNTSQLSAGVPVTGTNPTNAVSKPVASVSESGGNVIVSFSSVQGEVYRVEYKDNLDLASWSILADQITGTGSAIQITDPGVGALPQRFYRLEVLK